MARNLHSVLFQGVPGWSLKSFIQIAERVREFVPEAEIKIFITGDAPAPMTDDPQVIYAHRQAMEWCERQFKLPKYLVFRRPADLSDFDETAVWCYPTHLPQPGDRDIARISEFYGAIPAINPIGVFGDEIFAGIQVYGIPAIDGMVRVRYSYEIIRLLTDLDFQESIRVPMMEYARSKECKIIQRSAEIDGWMTRHELGWLVEQASQMHSVAEIGCWKGRSTTALASACNGHVWAIDHWQGGKNEPAHIKEAAAEDKVFREFENNTLGIKNIRVIRASSVEAANEFATYRKGIGPDMTFIDGGHGYDDVVADIRAWLPHTHRLICGHDFNWTEVRKAVTDELGEVDSGPGAIWYKWLNREARSNAA